MRRRLRRFLSGFVVLGLSCGLCAADPTDEGYSPVTPKPTLDAALRSSLKTVRDWLNDKDFASTARETQGLAALAHLYTYQGGDRVWRVRATALADTCSRLSAAARKKDADTCDKLVVECTVLLDELAARSPGERTREKTFKPRGGVTTWMQLMDAAYSDAKTAKKSHELERLAQVIVEEANASQHLRSDANWRRMSLDVRAAALDVAAKAKTDYLTSAKSALKIVFRRCEVCHDRSSRR